MNNERFVCPECGTDLDHYYGHDNRAKLLEFIKKTPVAGELSYRAIGSLTGINGPQLVKHHLEQLKKAGIINLDKKNGILSLKIDEYLS